jgi:hypothetical protein
MLIKLSLKLSVLIWLLMLSACSTKPTVLPFKPQEAPKIEIQPEYLTYCAAPFEISKTMPLQQALNNLVLNHGIYAECMIKHKGLVDAIKRRDK